jgi:hypothetical protein
MQSMPEQILDYLRLFALVAAGLQIACATVLWPFLWTRLVQPWIALIDRSSIRWPAALRTSRGMQILTLAFVVPALVLWWGLGLPCVREAFVSGLVPPP